MRFAQRILGVFKENQEKRSKKSDEVQFELTDFMDIFKFDKFGDQILKILNAEVKRDKYNAARQKRKLIDSKRDSF